MFVFRSVLFSVKCSSVFSHISCRTFNPLKLTFYNKSFPDYRHNKICNVNCIFISNYSTREHKKHKNVQNVDIFKEKIIQSINFQNSEDAKPFYKLPVKSLIHISKVSKNDEESGFCKNRLYYLSSQLKCPPAVLAEKIVRRLFVYSLSFSWLERSLNVLLEMGVAEDRILRDLWVLKYHHETILERLQRVRNLGIDNLYPWMVRCSEEILNRYVSIYQERKMILGDTESTHEYLANRLNINVEDVQDMCLKLPTLKTIRVSKVKHFLDFLIAAGFTVEDIAAKPRVLAASQRTVEDRLQQLRTLGLNTINLNVLCRSKKGFKKYLDSMNIANFCSSK